MEAIFDTEIRIQSIKAYRSTQEDIKEFQLDELIESNNKDIADYIAKLQMYAAANVKDIVPEEWKEQPMDWLAQEIDSIMSILEEDIIENYKWKLFKDYKFPLNYNK